MQVTLVQSEIEQALRDFIHSQISVKEGMEINITLKATRGDEGTTAIIDIVKPEPAALADVGKAQVATRTVTATKAEVVKDTPKATQQVKATRVAEPTPEVEQEPKVKEPEPEVEDPEPEPDQPEVESDQPEPEPERPVSKAASLFAGLQKPKNP